MSKNTVLDWIGALARRSLLVVGDYLGTISHTLTAVEVLRMKGVEIAAIVVSEQDDSGGLFAETIAEIGRWAAPAKVFGLGRGEGGEGLLTALTGAPRNGASVSRNS